MKFDQPDELQEALKAYIEVVNKKPVPDELLRLAKELNHLLERQQSK